MATVPLSGTKESYLREALLFYERGDYSLAKNVLVDHVFVSTVQDSGGNNKNAPMHPMAFAEALLLLGNIHAAQGEMEACDRRYSECYEVIQEEYCGVHGHGPRHIGLAIVLINHSSVLIRRWEALNHLHLSEAIRPQTTHIVRHHFEGNSRSSSAAVESSSKHSHHHETDSAMSHHRPIRTTTATTANSLHSLGMLAAGIGVATNGTEHESNNSPMKLINEAMSMLKSAYSIAENTLGADRLVFADCLHNMGCCHHIAGNASVDALECFMRSLKIRERVPEGNPSERREDRNVGDVNARSASGASSSGLSRYQMVTLSVSAASTSSLKIAATLEHIAMILFHLHMPEHPNTGRLKQAEGILSKVAATRKRILGPLSIGYAEALFNLATVESELGQKRDAYSNFLTCHSIRAQALGEGHELSLLALLMMSSTKVWRGTPHSHSDAS